MITFHAGHYLSRPAAGDMEGNHTCIHYVSNKAMGPCVYREGGRGLGGAVGLDRG